MTSGSTGVAEVEEQLRAVRRRLNSLTLQRVSSLVCSAALVLVSALVALALRASTTAFHSTLWAGLVAIAAFATFCAWRARRDWLSPTATAYVVDRHAHLDNRLTTLHTARAAQSRLHPLLVEQALDSRDRWTPQQLAPRRLSRATALVPLALALLSISSFYARPPAAPRPLRNEATLASGRAAAHIDAGGTGPPGSAPSASGSAGDDAAGGGAAAAGIGARSSDAGAERGPTRISAAAPGSADSRGASAERVGPSTDLRNLIRATFGDGEKARSAGGPDRSGGRPEGRNQPEADSASASAPSPAADQHAQAAGKQRGAGSPAPGAEGPGRGGSSGQRGAGAAGGLFGAEGRDGRAGGEGQAKPLAVALRAFSIAAPSSSERQARAGDTDATGSADDSERPPAVLSSEQRADAALQKGTLSPEHESVIRRIFTRQ